METLLFLFAAGFIGGGMNALAGGGSFVTLPSLIAAGVPSVMANASSTVALWPGGAASAWTYHERFKPVCGVALPPMLIVTFLGGLVGSLLLIWTPSSAFNMILPWLLLLATLALAFGRKVGAALAGRLDGNMPLVLGMQFVLGIYGGYFGGAVGLMMMAAWSLMGEMDLKALNAPRTLLVTTANSIAAIAFTLAGEVAWPQAIAMLLGGLVGGYAGARLGKVLPGPIVRVGTICTTATITAAFFYRAYIHSH